jgi:hypothetical protein
MEDGMRIRDLKRKHRSVVISAWPPDWTPSDGPGSTFPQGEEGVLTGVERRPGGWPSLTMKFDGREHHGILAWDKPPSMTDVERALRGQIGRTIQEIGDVEIGTGDSTTSPKVRIGFDEAPHRWPR